VSKILYNRGHSIDKEIIENTLKNLNCKSIQNNDYHGGERIIFKGIIPDYICYYFGKKCAVEIGDLNTGVGGFRSKINKLLQDFEYVIHIFPDKNYFLLHCILYEEMKLISSKAIGEIRQQQQKCIDMLSKLDDPEPKVFHN